MISKHTGLRVEEEFYIPSEVRIAIYWQLARMLRDPGLSFPLTRAFINSVYMLLESLPRDTVLLEQPCEELRETVKAYVRSRGMD